MSANPLKIDLENQQVRIDRTYLLDATFNSLRRGQNLLPEDLPIGYIDEMTSPTRTVREVGGKRRARYEKRGPDDYAHAEAFDELAASLLTALAAEEESVLVPISEVLPLLQGYAPEPWLTYLASLEDEEPEYRPGPG